MGTAAVISTLQQTTKNHAELRLVPRNKNKYYSFGRVATPDDDLKGGILFVLPT